MADGADDGDSQDDHEGAGCEVPHGTSVSLVNNTGVRVATYPAMSLGAMPSTPDHAAALP